MKNYIRLLNIIYKIDYSQKIIIIHLQLWYFTTTDIFKTLTTDILYYFSETFKFTKHQISLNKNVIERFISTKERFISSKEGTFYLIKRTFYFIKRRNVLFHQKNVLFHQKKERFISSTEGTFYFIKRRQKPKHPPSIFVNIYIFIVGYCYKNDITSP